MFPYTQLFVNVRHKTFVVRNNMQMDIGRALIQICADRHITAAELARRTGMTPGTISRYKSGQVIPSLEALEALATAIGCHVYEIVARAEGVSFIPAEESADDAEWRQLGRVMEPPARYAVADLVKTLTARK